MQEMNLIQTYNKPFLTPKEVAEVLSLSIFTVYNLLKSGKLKGVKLSPKIWRIRREELDYYIDSGGGHSIR